MGFGIVLPAQQFPLAATAAQPRLFPSTRALGREEKEPGKGWRLLGQEKKRRGELQGSNPVAF